MAWDPIDEGELIPGGAVLKQVRKLWNCSKWLFGNLGSVIVSGVQNGSFEVDSDGSGAPDGWTFSAYAGGTVAQDTTAPAHGAAAVKIIHPGGVGSGGGELASDYVPCDQLTMKFLSFIHWASAAGMKNRVIIKYYTAGKIYISSATLYESTANPATPTNFIIGFTPPATARYYKVILVGGYTDTNVAGTAYFDGLKEPGLEIFSGASLPFTMNEVFANNFSFTDVSSVTLAMPFGGLPVVLAFPADVKSGSEGTAVYQRFRVGGYYSNEGSTTSAAYVTTNYSITFVPAIAGSVTLVMQTKVSASFGVYGRKTDSSCTMRYDHSNA